MLSKRQLSALSTEGRKMNNIQKVLRKIERNAKNLDELELGGRMVDPFSNSFSSISSNSINASFNSRKGSDFSTLGTLIATNTHITRLNVIEIAITALDASNRDFYDGLKQNSSIDDLFLHCRHDPLGEVAEEVLKVYQQKNNLYRLGIGVNLPNGGIHTVSATLQRCTNLNYIRLSHCNINDRTLLPIVEAIRGHGSLKKLCLTSNRIGNTGCEALVTLLEDTNCNIEHLWLNDNRIDNITTITNSLANNTKLKMLYLQTNPMPIHLEDPFSTSLCNTTSINSIHSSNHTLENLRLYPGLIPQLGPELQSLLKLNKIKNKRHVAIKKILKYHPNIDMEPYFADWISDDEQTLKGLPYVVAWFERANEIFPKLKNKKELANLGISQTNTEAKKESYDIDPKKLSAIFQFTRAMPLSFAAATPFEVGGKKKKKKRKRR